jgi:hypothetical protein
MCISDKFNGVSPGICTLTNRKILCNISADSLLAGREREKSSQLIYPAIANLKIYVIKTGTSHYTKSPDKINAHPIMHITPIT